MSQTCGGFKRHAESRRHLTLRLFRLLLDYVERVECVLEGVGQGQIALLRLSVQLLKDNMNMDITSMIHDGSTG